MRDHISDFLVRLKNGQKAKLLYVTLYYPVPSKILNILKILYKKGFIRGFKVYYKGQNNNKKVFVKVFLKYEITGQPVIKNVNIISKPSKRVYVSIKNLWKHGNGFTIFVLSTPYGIITDQEARIYNCGGELLFSII